MLAANIFRERTLWVGGVDPNQRLLQSLGMDCVIPAIAPLHAQAALVAGTLSPLSKNDPVDLAIHVVGDRTSDAAIGTNGINRFQLGARPKRQTNRLVHQRTRGASCRAFATGHTGALAHRLIQIESDA